MMTQDRSRSSKTKIAAASLAALILVAVCGLTAHHYQFWPFTPVTPSTAPAETAEKNASVTSNKNAKTDAQASSSNVDTSKSTSEIPVAPTLGVNITDLSQASGMVNYTALITGASASGTCSAVFTSTISRPVTRTTTSSRNQCGPVSIPQNEFSAIGKWTLTLRFYINDTQAVATKDIEIR